MLGSRRRHASSSRKDVWQAESDSDRPRPAASASKTYTAEYTSAQNSNDRIPRSSRRPDASGRVPPSSAPSTAHKLSPYSDQAYAPGQAYYPGTNHYPPAPAPMATATVTSSRVRTQDATHDTYDLRAYLKRRTDRRSPRSSDEKLYMTDPGKPSRTGATQRSGYTSSTPAPQTPAPPTSQQYWAPASQPIRDPVMPQPSRDKEKEDARERRRLEKEAARARLEEERMRERATEREREREKERRREEKELRRAERERERELERRREEKEQDRRRRHKEKERLREQAGSNAESRAREHYSRQTAAAQISAAAGALKQYAESKLSVRSQWHICA